MSAICRPTVQIVLFFLLLLCSFKLRAQQRSLHIFYTGEVHGVIKSERAGAHGDILRIHAALKAYMYEYGLKDEDVLIFDTGNTLSYSYLSRMDSGRSVVRQLIDAGYDGLTVADMDFKFGLKNLQDLANMDTSLTFFASNLREDSIPLFQKTRIYHRQGLRIGVMGLINRLRSAAKLKDVPSNLVLDPPELIAAELAEELRPQCDVILALNHMAMSDNLKLSQKVPALQILVSSPSPDSIRMLWGFTEENRPRSLIIKSAPSATSIGHLIVDFEIVRGRTRMQGARQGEPIPVSDRTFVGVNPKPFYELKDKFRNYIKENYNGEEPARVLATIPDDRKYKILDFSLFSLLRSTHSEVAIVNEGSMIFNLVHRTDSNLTIRDVYAMSRPYDYLVTLRMTGKQIKAILKKDKAWPRGSPQSLRFMAIKNYGREESRPEKIHNVKIEDNETYAVVTHSFLANGGDGYSEFTKGTHRRDQFEGDGRLIASENPEARSLNIGQLLIRQLLHEGEPDFRDLEKYFKKNKYLNRSLWTMRFENFNLGFRTTRVANNEGFENPNDARVDVNTQNSLNLFTNGYWALIRQTPKFRLENGIRFRYGIESIGDQQDFQESDDRLEFQVLFDWKAFKAFKPPAQINVYSSLRYDTEFTANEVEGGRSQRKDMFVFLGLSNFGKHDREYRLAVFSKNSFATGRRDIGAELNVKYYFPWKTVRFGSFVRARYLFIVESPRVGDERASLDMALYFDFKLFGYLNIKPQLSLFLYRDAFLNRTASNTQVSINISFTSLWKPQYIKLVRKNR